MAQPSPLPSVDLLRTRLFYDPDTGVLRHAVRGRECTEVADGSLRVRLLVDGKIIRLRAHRAIWKMVTGQDPAGLIDHRDGNPFNNRWINLREASHQQNMSNMRKHRGSLPKGVAKLKNREMYIAQLYVDGKQIYLGRHSTPEGAHTIYCAGATRYFGDFARGA